MVAFIQKAHGCIFFYEAIEAQEAQLAISDSRMLAAAWRWRGSGGRVSVGGGSAKHGGSAQRDSGSAVAVAASAVVAAARQRNSGTLEVTAARQRNVSGILAVARRRWWRQHVAWRQCTG
jgi:hypothetical protein